MGWWVAKLIGDVEAGVGRAGWGGLEVGLVGSVLLVGER